MRFKEIKPGMVVHCENDEEKKALLEEAERLGYVWYGTKEKPTEKIPPKNTIHFHDAEPLLLCGYKYTTYSTRVTDTIKFSDLLAPVPSAEEALRIRNELSFDFVRKYLGLRHIHNLELDKMLRMATNEQVIDMCYQWQADQEKKEPEIETVYICRIIEMLPDGRRRCVHEEDIKPDPDLPFGGEREKVEEILKRYSAEHEGKFIAVHEVVSRVKEA